MKRRDIILIVSVLSLGSAYWLLDRHITKRLANLDLTPGDTFETEVKSTPSFVQPVSGPCEPLNYGDAVTETTNGVPLDTLIDVMETDYWGNPFPMKMPLGYLHRGLPGATKEIDASIVLGDGASFRVHMPFRGYNFSNHYTYTPPDFCKDGEIQDEVQQYTFGFGVEIPVPNGAHLTSWGRGEFGTLRRHSVPSRSPKFEGHVSAAGYWASGWETWNGFWTKHAPHKDELSGYLGNFENSLESPYLITGGCVVFTCGFIAEFPDRGYAIRLDVDKAVFHRWPEMLETAMLFIEAWHVDPEKPSQAERVTEIRKVIEEIYYE